MSDTSLPIDVEEYLAWLVAERGRSVNTVAAYRRDLVNYVAWLAANRLDPTSATGSANGIVFTYDGGVAFDAGTMLFDPTVVRTASGWSMWVDRGGTAQHATSTDGLTFVAADNSVFPNPATFPWGGTTLPDGRIRVVASVRGPGGADGLLFESNDGGRSYVQIASGLVPAGAPADTGLTYLNGTWWLLNSERM